MDIDLTGRGGAQTLNLPNYEERRALEKIGEASALGFKARVDRLPCVFCRLHAMDSSGSSLVRHLLTSWRPEWRPSRFDPRLN